MKDTILYSLRECRDYDLYAFYHTNPDKHVSEWVEKYLDDDYFQLKKRYVDGPTSIYKTVGYFDTFEDAYQFLLNAYN